MKKAYKNDYETYYVSNGKYTIMIYTVILVIDFHEAPIESMDIRDLIVCELSEAVKAFDKVVKSLKDKMI